MKRVIGFITVTAMALTLAGCASTSSANAPAMAVTRNAITLAAGPTPQDPNPHGGGFQAVESNRAYNEGHAGIPTPEPAAPEREAHFAGPTPQIPIPGSGRAGISRE